MGRRARAGASHSPQVRALVAVPARSVKDPYPLHGNGIRGPVAQGEEGPRPPVVPPNTTTTGPAPPPGRPKREVVRAIIAEAWRFAGPLPPPELFAEYDRVLPGSAERILAMAEREQ